MGAFWAGFLLGIFIGSNIGLLVAALCISAKRGDNDIPNIRPPL